MKVLEARAIPLLKNYFISETFSVEEADERETIELTEDDIKQHFSKILELYKSGKIPEKEIAAHLVANEGLRVVFYMRKGISIDKFNIKEQAREFARLDIKSLEENIKELKKFKDGFSKEGKNIKALRMGLYITYAESKINTLKEFLKNDKPHSELTPEIKKNHGMFSKEYAKADKEAKDTFERYKKEEDPAVKAKLEIEYKEKYCISYGLQAKSETYQQLHEILKRKPPPT